MKFGALNECPECERPPVEHDLSIQFTDHYLTSDELASLSRAVQVIHDLHLDDEEHLYSFLYFVGRKWPKVLEISLDGLSEDTADVVRGVFRSHLTDMSGQETSTRVSTPWERRSWTHASSEEFAQEELAWDAQVRALTAEFGRVLEELDRMADQMALTGIMSRLRSWWHGRSPKSSRMSWTARIDLVRGSAEDLARQVVRAREPVKNGWSRRSQERIQYLNGLAKATTELVDLTYRAAAHREGKAPLLPSAYRSLQEEWRHQSGAAKATSELVAKPHLIEDPLSKSVH